MKFAVVISLVLAMIGQIAWAQQPDAGTDQAAIRRQIEEMQATIEKLQQKLDDIDAVVNDPEGQVQTMQSDLNKEKKVAISGYLQTRYEWFEGGEDSGSFNDGFNIRRARIKVTATPSDRTSAVLQLDMGGNKVSVKDAYLTYGLTPASTLAFGQMNWPFGYEVVYSSSKRETPERALAFRRLFPGERDRGAKVTFPVGVTGTGQIGFYDGTGVESRNTVTTIPAAPPEIPNPITITSSSSIAGDFDHHKDIVANAAWKIGNIEWGVSGYFGEGIWNSNRSSLLKGVDKTRYGADFRYFGPNWTFKTEYVRGKGVDESASTWNTSDWISGYYGQINYNTNISNTLVARYSAISDDPKRPAFGRRTSLDLGLIHHFNDKLKVKLFRQTNGEETGEIDNNGYRLECLVTY